MRREWVGHGDGEPGTWVETSKMSGNATCCGTRCESLSMYLGMYSIYI